MVNWSLYDKIIIGKKLRKLLVSVTQSSFWFSLGQYENQFVNPSFKLLASLERESFIWLKRNRHTHPSHGVASQLRINSDRCITIVILHWIYFQLEIIFNSCIILLKANQRKFNAVIFFSGPLGNPSPPHTDMIF